MSDENEGAETCAKCGGCGLVADTEGQEPWTEWTALPLQSSAAVLMGLVRPIRCPSCIQRTVLPAPNRLLGQTVDDLPAAPLVAAPVEDGETQQ
jgi:hypothetical protein